MTFELTFLIPHWSVSCKIKVKQELKTFVGIGRTPNHAIINLLKWLDEQEGIKIFTPNF